MHSAEGKTIKRNFEIVQPVKRLRKCGNIEIYRKKERRATNKGLDKLKSQEIGVLAKKRRRREHNESEKNKAKEKGNKMNLRRRINK